MIQRVAFGLLTIILLIIILLMFFEFLLWIFWNGKPAIPDEPTKYSFYKNEHPEISFTLIPNHLYKGNPAGGTFDVNTNNEGFRIDRKISRKKDAGTFRIALLGDSVTFGYMTPEKYTLSALLAAKLNSLKMENINKVEVLNFAIPGYNIDQYKAVLEYYAVNYRPDLIITGITIYNDLDGHKLEYLGEGHYYKKPVSSFTGVNISFSMPPKIISSSNIWRFLHYKFNLAKWDKTIYAHTLCRYYYKKYDKENGTKKFNEIYNTIPNMPAKSLIASVNEEDPVWENVENSIDGIINIAKKVKAPVYFVLFPTNSQIYYDDMSLKPQEILKKIISNYNAECIDLVGPFRSFFKASGHIPFKDIWAHMSYDMNEYISGRLRDIIIQKVIRADVPPINSINPGDGTSEAFLSFGWSEIRKKDNLLYRNIRGNHARIIFKNNSKGLSSISITAAPYRKCASSIQVFLNDSFIGKIDLKSSEFSRYLLEINRKIDLSRINHLDLVTDCSVVEDPTDNLLLETKSAFSYSIQNITLN